MTNTLNIETPLINGDIELHPLKDTHFSELEKLAKDERLWKFGIHPFHQDNLFREKWITNALSQIKNHDRVCFAVFYQGKMVGSTSYYHIDLDNKKLTIGYTWLHPDYWGSPVNRLIKLAMFEYAFEKRGCLRVEFQVDSINLPSQHALQKLGIKQEGLLRNHMLLSNGRVRHTYVYGVIREEWPEIKQRILTIVNR